VAEEVVLELLAVDELLAEVDEDLGRRRPRGGPGRRLQDRGGRRLQDRGGRPDPARGAARGCSWLAPGRRLV
jgi:hypothetical protein